jgi:hypothetical protein
MILPAGPNKMNAASIAFLEKREGGEQRRHNLKCANAGFYDISPGGRLNLLQKLYNTGNGKLLVTYKWV